MGKLTEKQEHSRTYQLKRKYGLSPRQYRVLLLKQKKTCLIYQKLFKDMKREPSVDHCHNCGQVRGLLCGKCNTALGLLDDDIHVLAGAIVYLQKHNHS